MPIIVVDPLLLVTVEELETRLGTTLDPDAAAQAVTLATALVTGYTGQGLMSQTYTHTLTAAYGLTITSVIPSTTRFDDYSGLIGVITLPQRPVVSVSTVVADGVTLTSGQWFYDHARAELQLQDPDVDLVTVTYTAGYDVIPADLKAVALSLAVDEINNPRGLASERLADYSVTYGAGSSGDASGLSARHRIILDRYRGGASTIRPR